MSGGSDTGGHSSSFFSVACGVVVSADLAEEDGVTFRLAASESSVDDGGRT